MIRTKEQIIIMKSYFIKSHQIKSIRIRFNPIIFKSLKNRLNKKMRDLLTLQMFMG
jgi:hypothetical protein